MGPSIDRLVWLGGRLPDKATLWRAAARHNSSINGFGFENCAPHRPTRPITTADRLHFVTYLRLSTEGQEHSGQLDQPLVPYAILLATIANFV